MSLIARCHPALKGLIPEPVPAEKALPDWLRAMPTEVLAESLGGERLRTLKQCPPLIDALGLGVMIPLPCDIEVKEGAFHWDWDFPTITDAPLTRAPLGAHLPEQATGTPLPLAPGTLAIKFTNYWTLEAPEGWQLLITHPMNRADLPFLTLSGLVSADHFGLGYVHFPALWTDPGFEGVLPKGTPVAQVIPVPRERPALKIAEMTEAEIAESRAIQEALQSEPGVYRKQFRK
ncbi:hypothetical protein [Thioclava pacifica]|uniref:Uncharacterized protein n=1 Tax=Thioclava pacifica DSM 10166 TaxID=1353537 RepID=A0A074JKG0_9RHOB|nr:hypothetical protein [Thioclava pacifica]KEO56380.1 hypothetical protein TP2_02300 [Thioclava pacifica DSM 10166]